MNKWLRIPSLICLLVPSLLLGQDFRATLTGTVTDSSNAAVPNAVIQATNTATNEIATTVTGAQGDYTIPFLKPATYTVTAQVAGFKKFVRKGVVLDVAQAATVNISLEIGAMTEEVTVVAQAPLLETAKADRGGVVDTQRVEEFPLNARNPFMLSLLTAGVNYNGNAIYQRPFDNGAIAEWGINGGTRGHGGNEFLLDGASNNAQAGGNNIAYVPPVDSVAEFKIQTNSYDAQYGKTSGGIINVSLKSGTNTLHGTGYEFARRNALDANSFQNNANNAPKAGHFLDQYGVQLGGPVYIPRLYDGRDKTFFMFNYEGYREAQPNPQTLSVPTPEMLNGDFSKLTDAGGNKITIYDPSKGVNAQGQRTPFGNNIIPPDRINPIAKKILSFMPRPNTVTPNAGYSQQNYFVPGGSNLDKDDFHNEVIKVDKNVGDKQRMFFRYAGNYRTEHRGTDVPNGSLSQDRFVLNRINYAGVVDWVRTFSPTLVFNVRASFNRYVEGSRGVGAGGFDLTTLGFPSSFVSQLPVPGVFGRYELDNYMSLGNTTFNFNYTNTFAAHPTVTKIHGAHSFKAGVDMRWIQYATSNVGSPFRFQNHKDLTQKVFNRGDALSGNSIATFLLGTPSAATVDYNTFPMYLYKYFAPYVQDDWKVNRRLTLNLGLRWDFNIPPNERHNRLDRSFDPNIINPVDKLIDRSKFPDVPTLRGGLLFAGVNGAPRIATDIYGYAVQPRLGFAYLLKDKLVMRGGWGRYFVNPNNDYLQNVGFSESTPYINSLTNGQTPIPNTINNPFPNGILVPPGSSLGPLTFLGRGFTFVNTGFKIPHVDQFSLGFEYQLASQAKLEVSYVGSRSKNLEDARSFNEMDLATRQKCDFVEGASVASGGGPAYCDKLLPNPFQGVVGFVGTGFFTDTQERRSTLSRPMPEFSTLTGRTRNDGASWYNSLQVSFEKRSRGGLTLTSTYTLSKQIDRIDFNDSLQGVMRQGLAQWDRPQRLTVGAVYQLPFGQGKRWLNASSGFWSRLVSGWENTWIFQWQSGSPWALPGNVIYVKEAKLPNINWSAPRVYGVKPCVARWNDDGTITMQKFSLDLGCTDYNFLETPRFAPRFTPDRDGRLRLNTAPQADVSLNKMTKVTEKLSVQFRAEGFNVFNTFMFHQQNFNNNPEDAKFGSIDPASVGIGSSNFPRQIQLAVKAIW